MLELAIHVSFTDMKRRTEEMWILLAYTFQENWEFLLTCLSVLNCFRGSFIFISFLENAPSQTKQEHTEKIKGEEWNQRTSFWTGNYKFDPKKEKAKQFLLLFLGWWWCCTSIFIKCQHINRVILPTNARANRTLVILPSPEIWTWDLRILHSFNWQLGHILGCWTT